MKNKKRIAENSGKMLKLLEAFPSQLLDAYRIGVSFRGLSRMPSLKTIVFSGVGGSAIGADVVKDLLRNRSKVPVSVSRSYRLPAFVDSGTLLVVSSYSGNTEETLHAYEEGRRRRAKIIAVSSGGKLEVLASRFGTPQIKLPCGIPPRMTIGYSVIPILLILDRLGVASLLRKDFNETVGVLEKQRNELATGISSRNEAVSLAEKLQGKVPVIYASDHLEAVCLRWRGQIEENAEALAAHHLIPEMNHNEIAGWARSFPMIKNLAAVLLRDSDEHPRVSVRMEITKKLIRAQGGSFAEARSVGRSLLARVFSLIYLGDFTSYYLAGDYGVDPMSIGSIEYVKKELAKV
ncbi:MAG TPA: bifunctional phosphoglucose/phosphomannose isomerase [Candidatus Omnitrophota bacterium]|nr:bifunctional phosphoglucose/phosphomannose isomerase [Candidatus Omnitrophota bacterium]